jgi:hypothetical protein
MVAHIYNHSTGEIEAGQPSLHSKLEATLGYPVKPCLQKTKKGNKKVSSEEYEPSVCRLMKHIITKNI